MVGVWVLSSSRVAASVLCVSAACSLMAGLLGCVVCLSEAHTRVRASLVVVLCWCLLAQHVLQQPCHALLVIPMLS